jgi:hypothetical protein
LLCVLTHRRLRAGSYEAFREAWRPDDWWPKFRHGYHLRSLDDPDEVVSFAFYDATMEEFEAMRDEPGWLEAEEKRLQRLAPLQISMRIGGVYDVAEEITAPA